jgi:hypothetical protein
MGMREPIENKDDVWQTVEMKEESEPLWLINKGQKRLRGHRILRVVRCVREALSSALKYEHVLGIRPSELAVCGPDDRGHDGHWLGWLEGDSQMGAAHSRRQKFT